MKMSIIGFSLIVTCSFIYCMENNPEKLTNNTNSIWEEILNTPDLKERLPLHKIITWKPKYPNGSNSGLSRKEYQEQYKKNISPKTIEEYKAECVQALIDLRAHVDALNEDGFTALHQASCKAKNTPIVKILLENKADPNKTDPNIGITALACAASVPNNKEIISLLLHYGADPLIAIDNQEISPLYCSAKICIENYSTILTESAKRMNTIEKIN